MNINHFWREASESVAESSRAAKRLWAVNKWFRVGLIGLIGLLLTLLIVHRYSPKSAELDCAFRIAESLPETKGDAHKVDNCVTLEEVSTNSGRTLGLSGRPSMLRNRGMLFDFQETGEFCMWMKDMHFALDMLWLNQQGEIIYMIEGVTPDTYPKSFCGPGEAWYVVEVNAGIVKAADLHVGQRLRL